LIEEQKASSLLLAYAGARIDITPSQPVPLAGYAGRTREFHSVSAPLEANAVLLASEGTRVLLVSADLLYFGPELVSSVRRRVSGYGLEAEHVIMTASHTHFAPATDRTKPLLGTVDAQYLRHVEQRLLELVDVVMTTPVRRVAIHAKRVMTELNVNRRRRWLLPTVTHRGLQWGPKVVMAPSPLEPRDPAADVLRVVDDHGDVVAVLWKYACHPVCFPDRLSVTSEFPGHARGILRRALGREIPVVFWQGFAGDVRPRLVGEPTLKRWINTIRRGPDFGDIGAPAWLPWADALASALVDGVGAAEARLVSGGLSVSTARLSLSALFDVSLNPQIRDRCLWIQRLTFGTEVEALFVAAEVCSPYLRLLGGNHTTICVGYSGDVYGYLPSDRQAAEGGYEGSGFFEPFGLRGSMRPGFERAVVGTAELLRHATSEGTRVESPQAR
jgi:hypothetical protein